MFPASKQRHQAKTGVYLEICSFLVVFCSFCEVPKTIVFCHNYIFMTCVVSSGFVQFTGEVDWCSPHSWGVGKKHCMY